jgi:spore germination cell wall hydrolase CwlJ-like protein
MFINKIKLLAASLVIILGATTLYVAPSLSQEMEIATTVAENFKEQTECLARNIYFEAASESYEGKLAVAQVTINRSKHPNYPKTICEVVYQKNGGTCQFSWTCFKNNTVRNKYEWEAAEQIAQKALTTTVLHDKLAYTNALYYHATYVNPGWRGKVITKIGNHIFYARI